MPSISSGLLAYLVKCASPIGIGSLTSSRRKVVSPVSLSTETEYCHTGVYSCFSSCFGVSESLGSANCTLPSLTACISDIETGGCDCASVAYSANRSASSLLRIMKPCFSLSHQPFSCLANIVVCFRTVSLNSLLNFTRYISRTLPLFVVYCAGVIA